MSPTGRYLPSAAGGSATRAREEPPVGKCLIRHANDNLRNTQFSAMPRHRFDVGQKVVAPVAGPHSLVPPGPYVVVRLLPIQDGEPGYHVRSEVDRHERSLMESRIRALPSEPPGQKPTTPPPNQGSATPSPKAKGKLRTGAV